MKERIAGSINTLGHFCGKRDVEVLTADSLQNKYGIKQADVMVKISLTWTYFTIVIAQAL